MLAEDDERSHRGGPDATGAVLRDLSTRVERCFDAVTIADVCKRGTALGLRPVSRERSNAAI